ncbi:MAG TPA: LptF/LptG family permease [Myxococcota bacterium]|nr:LptF/LptG family permease [Myxococcota bacterium]
MRPPRILTLYVAREVLQYAALGFLGVGAILLTQNALRQLEDFASVGLRFGDVLAILGALVAMLSSYAVPVAFLFGVLVAVGRLSADSELKAMRALGVSLAQFAVPFLCIAVGVAILTAWLLAEVEPAARTRLRGVAADIASRGNLIEPGSFRRLDREGMRLLFVEERAGDQTLRGVLLADRTDAARPFTVVASRARLELDREAARAHLVLEEGDIHFEPEDPHDDTYRRIGFGSFDYSFDVSALVGNDPCAASPGELDSRRIREVLHHFETHNGKPPDCIRVKTPERYEVQYHRRLALPFAPILFAFLGVSLGMRRTRGARSFGMLLCIGLVFSYYALLSFGTFLAEDERLPAGLALWLPNFVFGAAAVPLLLRARRAES